MKLVVICYKAIENESPEVIWTTNKQKTTQLLTPGMGAQDCTKGKIIIV